MKNLHTIPLCASLALSLPGCCEKVIIYMDTSAETSTSGDGDGDGDDNGDGDGDGDGDTGLDSTTIFVSSARWSGQLDGLEGADQKCQELADAAGLEGSYTAWLSDGTSSAAERIAPSSGPYLRTDGAVIADDWDDLVDGTIAARIELDEAGLAAVGGHVWTGLEYDGSPLEPHCQGWTSELAGDAGIVGEPQYTDVEWTAHGQAPCNELRHLYCVQSSGPGGDGDGDGDDGLCGNGVLDGNEECDDGNDDDTDACTSLCRPPSCIDGLASGDESDVDCGGSCQACQPGYACEAPTDCTTDACEAGFCVPATQVVAGASHTCVLLAADGALRCWGEGADGRLGYGETATIGDDETPNVHDFPVEIGGSVIRVAAGASHTCALLAGSGGLRCWGAASRGQLGYGDTNTIGDDELPASATTVPVGEEVTALVAGSNHVCALLELGTVRCWGDNTYGQLGRGHTQNIGDDEVPADVGALELGGRATRLASGYDKTCAVLEGGDIRCWGRGSDYSLGYGDAENIGDNELPTAAGPLVLGGAAVQLAVGQTHTCALLDDGSVHCWGTNTYGQLGYGHTDPIGDDELPGDPGPVMLGDAAIALAAGASHTCALLAGGSLRCWGRGASGRLGLGTTQDVGDDELPTAFPLVDLGGPAVQLTVGEAHTCALLDGGIGGEDEEVRCWGLASSGQLGYGNTNTIGDDELPSAVGPVPYL